MTAELLHSSAGTSCAPVLPTQPNIWTAHVTIAQPQVVAVPTTVSAMAATSLATRRDTGVFLCR